MTDLSVETVATASLTPYKNNARFHSDKQVQQIERSIREFGFVNPILVDEAKVVIAGHGRLLAARSIGLDSVPVITLWGLSDIQTRQLRIADNKIALNSAWDKDLLQIELQEILQIDTDVDLTITGHDTGELDVILNDTNAIDVDDEVIPALPSTAVTRTGDLWWVGRHAVICGDSRSRDVVDKLVSGATMHAAFIDPPYGCKIDGGAVKKGSHRDFKFASGEMSSEELTEFFAACLGNCAAVTKDGGVHFVCMDHHHLDELFTAGKRIYSKRLNLCVWNKSNAGMGGIYRSKHELIAVYQVGRKTPLNNVQLGRNGRNRTNVWDYPSVNTFNAARSHDLKLHPTVKPIRLVADAIMDVTRRGECVIDSCLGSGTTLLAAERVGRICYGVEVDALYVDLALERFRAQTGIEAILIETGATFTEVAKERALARDAHGK